MKRILAISLSLCVAIVAMAQQADSAAILQRIYEANKSVVSLQASYTHHRTSGRNSDYRVGNFYYIAASQQLAMRYTEPEGRYFVVSDNHLKNKIGAIPMHFNMKRNKLMRLFGNCMVWAVRGDVRSIYENNNVDMEVQEDKADDCYTITMTAKSGFNKGISRIVLKYDRQTCLLFHLKVNEIINVDHVFVISRNPSRDHAIDQAHFEV